MFAGWPIIQVGGVLLHPGSQPGTGTANWRRHIRHRLLSGYFTNECFPQPGRSMIQMATRAPQRKWTPYRPWVHIIRLSPSHPPRGLSAFFHGYLPESPRASRLRNSCVHLLTHWRACTTSLYIPKNKSNPSESSFQLKRRRVEVATLMHSEECPGPRTCGGTCSLAGGRPETLTTSHQKPNCNKRRHWNKNKIK